MENREVIEDKAMQIISYSGTARSLAFQALTNTKEKKYSEAKEQLEQADGFIQSAHEAHTSLLKMDSKGEIERIDMLLSHAQDHLMTSTLAVELLREIVDLRKTVADLG